MQSEMVVGKVMEQEKQPVALVTDANRGSALAIIRSLAREGWRTIAADSDRRSLGFHSRYSHDTLLYPSPTQNAEAFAQAIVEAVQGKAVDLVIPTTDEAILPLAASRDRFDGLCRVAMPDEEGLRRVTDKQMTLALARELGVPTPLTFVAEGVEEALDVAHLLAWPMVLKAQRSRKLTGGEVQPTGRVGYANNVKELAEEVQRLRQVGPVLMQQFYAGSGQGVELLAYQGRVLAAFQHKRLAEIPITGGASALRESVALDPHLFEYSRRLVQALNWTGLLMVEFKVSMPAAGRGSDTANAPAYADGSPAHSAVLMEVNGRVWGSLPLAVYSGMDFPARLAHLYRFGPPPVEEPAATSYKIGVRACNLDLMLLWIAQVATGSRRYPFIPQPRRHEALLAVLGLFDPRRRYDVQTVWDPAPGILQLRQTLSKLWHKRGSRP